jgi:hypothetical protein
MTLGVEGESRLSFWLIALRCMKPLHPSSKRRRNKREDED